MSNALPRRFYGDPAETLSRYEAREVFQKERCLACKWWDIRRGDLACYKRLVPGENWCKGFEEK